MRALEKKYFRKFKTLENVVGWKMMRKHLGIREGKGLSFYATRFKTYEKKHECNFDLMVTLQDLRSAWIQSQHHTDGHKPQRHFRSELLHKDTTDKHLHSNEFIL